VADFSFKANTSPPPAPIRPDQEGNPTAVKTSLFLHLVFVDTFIEHKKPSGTSKNGMLTFAAILFFETPTVGFLFYF
jgi:hypothetical protein